MLLLEPFKGKIPAKSHINIKMTLKASPMPSAYEGEIECAISWQNDHGDEATPQAAPDVTPTIDQNLFLRIKKSPVIVKIKQTKNLNRKRVQKQEGK